MRDAVQPEGHGARCRNGANADGSVRPQHQAGQRRAGNQAHTEDLVDKLEGRHQAHLTVGRDHELLHRRARKAGFAVGV